MQKKDIEKPKIFIFSLGKNDNVFCNRAIISIKTIYKSVAMETYKKSWTDVTYIFSLWSKKFKWNFNQGELRPTIKPILYILFKSFKT